MPTLSMFFGLIIEMYYASKEHNTPHILVRYQGDKLTNQQINKLTNQQINKSTNQQINKSTN